MQNLNIILLKIFRMFPEDNLAIWGFLKPNVFLDQLYISSIESLNTNQPHIWYIIYDPLKITQNWQEVVLLFKLWPLKLTLYLGPLKCNI